MQPEPMAYPLATYWWLSFADETAGHNLGVVVVHCAGDDIVAAVAEAWSLDCNPGGQVRGMPLRGVHRLPEELVGRLIIADTPDYDQLQRAIKAAWTYKPGRR